MQIQRIQTVYIFLALVAMMIFVIVPYGEVDYLSGQPVVTEKLYTMYEYGLLIPAAAAVILLIVDIFLFRNLPLQRTVLTISLLLTLCCTESTCSKSGTRNDSPSSSSTLLCTYFTVSCSPRKL